MERQGQSNERIAGVIAPLLCFRQPKNTFYTPREVKTIFTVRSRIERSSQSVQFAM